MRILPANGLKVRDPVRKDLLPAEGREVSDTDPFWHRRLTDGDVVLAIPEPPPPIVTDDPPQTKRLATGTTRSTDE